MSPRGAQALLRHTETESKWLHSSRASWYIGAAACCVGRGCIEQARAIQVQCQPRWRASWATSATYSGGSTWPPVVFSSTTRRVRAKCGSSGLMAAAMSARRSVPSGWVSTGCGWIEPSTAMPPASQR